MGAVYGDRVHEVKQDWRIRTVFRLLKYSAGIRRPGVVGLQRDRQIQWNFYNLRYTVCSLSLGFEKSWCMKKKNLPLTTTIRRILS
jgi:hypothetical protein